MLWFYDLDDGTTRLIEPADLPPATWRAVRRASRPVSPALWFATILETLRELGYGLPTIPNPPAAAVLVYWNADGEAAFFPLAFADDSREQTVELGHLLHQIAQVMIEDPDAWAVVEVGEDEEGW